MDTDTRNVHIPVALRRLLPAVGPALLISVAYVDPGKWAATVEGGARFGIDLVLPMLFFNLAAILCQYLSAKVGIITGRDLAQICSEEYDKGTCMLLGIQTAVSVMALDLSMVLGIAHGLNLLLGLDLPTCIFLTAVDAVLFPFLGAFLKHKGYYPSICVAGSLLLFYFLGVLISQPEVPLSLNGMLMKLSEESAFALMSLLGASVMPHNFYMHSSIVLHHPRSPNVSKSSLCYDNFLAILCIFSGIYLVNYVLMNSAANVFHSTGLVLVTFPDAMSLMEQVFRSPVAPLFFVVILYLSNQISALTWNHGGQVVVHDFLLLDIPNWLQRATTRIVAIVPALYCVWTSGVEGAYQLLIFSQVMVALLLPSSVIPLFRVASSRAIMGAHKISQVLEFLAVITFMGMLGLKIIFVVEMIFGDSDWIGNLQWNMGSSSSVPYLVLILTAFTSFCLMLWLAATPLKSATLTDAQPWNWDAKQTLPEPSMRRDETYLGETRFEGDPVMSFDGYTDRTIVNADPHLPEPVLDSHKDLHLRPVVDKETQSDMKLPSPMRSNQSEMKIPSPPLRPNQSEMKIPSPPLRPNLSDMKIPSPLGPNQSEMKIPSPLGPNQSEMKIPSPLRPNQSEMKIPSPLGPNQSEMKIPSPPLRPNLSDMKLPSPQRPNQSDLKLHSPLEPDLEPAPSVEPVSVPKEADMAVTELDLPDSSQKVESLEPIEKTVSMEGDLLPEKESQHVMEPEEPSKGVPSLTSDGPSSFRSLSGKSDDGGNGAGSLSRLAGLGRAARRQLATVLDEFWGQLYDFHGQATQDAKNRRLDLLLIDPKLSFSFLKADPSAMEYNGHLSRTASKGSESFCDSPRQMTLQNTLDSPYGGRTSLLSNHSQLLDNFSVASSSVVDPSERRYSSVRNLPSSDGWVNSQPATNVMDPSERRYSSVRNLPSSDSWGNTQPTTNVMDPSERRYSSVRNLPSSDSWGNTQPQPTTNAMDASERRYSSVRTLPSSDSWGNNTQPATNVNVMDPSERRYSSVRNLPSSDSWGNNTQPASNVNAMDPSERRYSSVRNLPSSDGWGNTQPATIHGYQIASIANRIAKERSSSGLNGGIEPMSPTSSAMGMQSYREPQASALGQRMGYQNFAVSRNSSLQSETQYYDADNGGQTSSTKKYHSLPDISGIAGPYRELYLSRQRDGSGGFASSLGRTSYESSLYPTTGSGTATSLGFDAFPFPTTTATTSTTGPGSLWSRQPFEQFGVGDTNRAVGSRSTNPIAREASTIVDAEAKLLRSFRCCIVKLLKLEGSDWLFRQNDGSDEDLIDRVAARERCLYEAEAREMGHLDESQSSSDKKKNDDASIASILVSSIPHCGEGCVWKADLIVSFGVWCIHRILDLSLMESRPELWGKYTYVLNRLQGIVEPAFLRPRTPMQPCFCLQLSAAHQQRL
ncbi:Ethylene-insensitive protein 2, partial [Linum grandiflorum]